MNKASIGIVEKMERTEFEPGSSRAPYQRLINPDGPEAAAIIMEMVEALELCHARLIAHPDRNTLDVAAIDKSRNLLAKVRGK